MELRPGLHHLSARGANIYLCEDEDGLTVIDTGPPWSTDVVLRYIGRLRYRPEAVVRILLTHADFDHAGSAAQLQSVTGATVLGSAATLALARRGEAPSHGDGWLTGLVGRMGYRPVSPDQTESVAEGQNLQILGNLRVLATPGHTPDHLSFYHESHGVLFAGDALFNVGGLRTTPRFLSHDPAAARTSALRLLALAPAVIACGHGRPLVGHKDDIVSGLYRRLIAGDTAR
jgi:glyoxylase-like metal-dependent hydrolase (beta-lactamase superfamily II)